MIKNIVEKSISVLLAFVVMFSLFAIGDMNPVKLSASAASTKKSIKATILKVDKVKKNSITLRWTKVKGAKGYRLYKYSDKQNKWVKVVTTESTKYTVKGLNSGTTFKFRVKAYKKADKKTVWSKASNTVVASTKLGNVTLKSVTSDITSVKIKWNKVKGAEGYQIAYSTDENFSKKNTVIIPVENKTSYTVEELLSNKTYFVKIRAYKTVQDKKENGAYSETVKIKTKNYKNFKYPVGVYQSKNLPSVSGYYDHDCPAWIGVYSVGKNKEISTEIKKEFEKSFGYEPLEKVKCTYIGKYFVNGYKGVQSIYQYTIEDLTYDLIIEDFYKLYYDFCDDGSPWVGFCAPVTNYYESDIAQKYLREIDDYFCEVTGYTKEYMSANPKSFVTPYCVIWSGPYRTLDGQILDEITYVSLRAYNLPFLKDAVCPECGDLVPAEQMHTINECKMYTDPKFREQWFENVFENGLVR